MSNVIAIADRELRSYFASPIAYAVIGLFALVFGWMIYSYLHMFLLRTMEMQTMGGAGAVNVNVMLIRPVIQQIGIIVLFVLPMITMRTYSEEKRSGTIELLLTSPVSDLEIILGKFFGAFTLYALMLLVTLPTILLLFLYGEPDWKPVVTAYLGMLLVGGSFIAFGLFISSLTKNQIVAAVLTFCILLMLLLVNWLRDMSGPTMGAVISAIALFEPLDDFTKGVIDTKHLIYYLSVITFGLFLTAKSVDSERWRG